MGIIGEETRIARKNNKVFCEPLEDTVEQVGMVLQVEDG